MTDKALARVDTSVEEWNKERIALLKRTIAKEADDNELELFIQFCKRTGLDPFARQAYAIHRWDNREKKKVMTIQVSIDGQRLIAERTGKYLGQTPMQWCGEDGVWKDVWLSKEPPAAAKVGVYKEGAAEPTYRVAHYDEYVQTFKDGNPMGLWAQMPRNMLAKCAESLALRAAFPQELSGVYSDAEMAQADSPPPLPKQVAAPRKVAEPEPVEVDRETGEIIGQYTEVEDEPPLTESQQRLILSLAKGVGLDASGLSTYLEKQIGAKSVGTLSKAQASAAIDSLREFEHLPPAEDEVDEVPFTLPDEEEEEVKVPGDGKEFFAFMRDFNKIQGLEGDDALAPDDIIFSDMDADQRLKMVKSMFWKALKTKVRKAGSAGELNEIKKDWGEHPAWVDELNGLWQSRLAQVGKPEGAMV